MPDAAPALTASPVLSALLVLEVLLLLGGLLLLVLRVRQLPGRFLGLSTGLLTPSAFRASEIFLAAAFAFGGGIIIQQIVALFAARWFPAPADDSLGVFHVLAGAGFQLGLLAGLAHAWFWHLRPSRRTFAPAPLIPHAAATPGQILRGGFATFLVALVVVTPVSLLWQSLLSALGIEPAPQDMVTLFSQTDNLPALALMVGLAVLIAPLTEELLFRIGLFRWLRTRTLRGVALFAPSLVFGAIHGNVAVLVPLAALAVVLSLGYEHYGHPGVPILAHALFNLNTIALVLAGFPV